MINISTNKQLNIILTNTNKALNEVIKNISTKESSSLPVNKDLKSILNSIFEKTSQNPSSDRTLLNLVKNNPTLKNLDTVSNTIKDLLNTIKSDKNPLPIEKTLKKFLIDIKDLDEPALKQKLKNSGVFLESKLKNVQNPQVELKTTLKALSQTLDNSKIFHAKPIIKEIKELLDTPIIKNSSNEALTKPQNEDLKSLEQIAKKVQNIIKKVQIHIDNSTSKQTKTVATNNEKNPINTKLKTPDSVKTPDSHIPKKTLKLIEKLSTFNSAEKLSSQHKVKEIISNDLKSVVLKTTDELSNSSHPNKDEIIKQLDKLSLTIDYQQLLSHLSNSSAIYLPFSWEQLENGNINIKKDKNNKFYCDIELKLKEYGELTLKLMLYDKNQLNLHIYSDNVGFRELIKENIPTLRSTLIDAQVSPREIRLFKKTKENPSLAYNTNENPMEMGFEVKA